MLLSSGLFPQGAIAQGPQDAPQDVSTLQDTDFAAPPKEKRELPQYRTDTSKRFQNPDGSFTEQIYKHPNFKVKLKSTANSGFMTFTKDDATVSLRPHFAGAAKGQTKDNVLTYENAAKDTDLPYSVQPYGLKEEIILKSAAAPSSFTFEMKLDNVTYEIAADGKINFFKEGQTTPVFTMPKPFMIDAKRNYSDDVSYKVRKDNDNKVWIDAFADAAWLKDPNRAFPVIIDPPLGAGMTEHADSASKVFELRKGGKELHWVADADEYGNFIVGKHKSDKG